ncbi:hypothetical protein NDU88_004005 [Pleurodeles waltl]|uniref:Uncharacterized protein n=1 Tax=Pleurodeles waltl TaxID=8319 RepID=A0AAV7SHN8_PLEWA|nr:hypothetical protein NDU88_004005 [Pleurodeles waltl]
MASASTSAAQDQTSDPRSLPLHPGRRPRQSLQSRGETRGSRGSLLMCRRCRFLSPVQGPTRRVSVLGPFDLFTTAAPQRVRSVTQYHSSGVQQAVSILTAIMAVGSVELLRDLSTAAPRSAALQGLRWAGSP